MRLCNAGDILEITSYCDTVPQTARTQATKLELVARSVWSIDGIRLISEEELVKYNESHKSNMTMLDYLRLWTRNLEALVVDRLEAVYDGLLQKQIRSIQGVALCEVCNTPYLEVPEGSKRILYSLGEIICPACLTTVNLADYDFTAETVVQPTSPPATPVPQQEPEERSFGGTQDGYHCDRCEQNFDEYEVFMAHRETCAGKPAV
jgi:hypothetical protein